MERDEQSNVKEKKKIIIFQIGGKFCAKLMKKTGKASGWAQRNVEFWKILHSLGLIDQPTDSAGALFSTLNLCQLLSNIDLEQIIYFFLFPWFAERQPSWNSKKVKEYFTMQLSWENEEDSFSVQPCFAVSPSVNVNFKRNFNYFQIEKGVAPSTALEGEEALDFEAEELVEEGECETEKEKEKEKEIETEIEKEEGEETEKENKEEKTGEDDEGECKEDLEEGELTDEGENRPEETEPRPICRFYSRGQCTWGSSCRLVLVLVFHL